MNAPEVNANGWTARVHHVSTLVQSIEDYLANSFWIRRSPIVHDSVQQARLCLVSIAEDDRHLVELIEPVGEDSPTYLALTKGQKLHHLCFEMPSTSDVDAFIQTHRLLPVTKWQPAPLFQGRLVRFAYTRNRELVEFLANDHIE